MKTLEEVSRYTLSRIQFVYRHPTLYSYQAHGVMTALWCFHEIWAAVNLRVDDFQTTLAKVCEEGNCGPNLFDTHYRLHLCVDRAPSEAEVTAYVIRQYQRIDERLGIVLPEDYIEKRSVKADTALFFEEQPDMQRVDPPSGAVGGYS
jgi:hypothetical protein